MAAIKNIIFDFGGVLYEIDIDRTINAFRKLAIITKPWQADQHSVYDQMEKGKVGQEEILNYYKSLVSQDHSDEIILNAFNAVLIDIYHISLDYLVRLRNNYNLILLSNTNEIHYSKFNAQINSSLKSSIFHDCFIKEYYSFKIGMRKPDEDIFKHVITDANIIPHETLFVDDTLYNLDSAKKLGLHTYWFISIDKWPDLITMFNLKLD